MRKIIYAILFAVVTAVSITSCTEESVTPTTQADDNSGAGGGGGGIADPLKP